MLKYANRSKGSWITGLVDSNGEIFRSNSIALDSVDQPRISYYYQNQTHEGIGFARLSGTTWNVELVDNGHGTGALPSLAIDGEGNPHVTYGGDKLKVGGELYYANETGNGWSIDLRASPAGQSSSLALDSDWYPHIAYDAGVSGLNYSRFTGSRWIDETLVAEGHISSQSLALDDKGNPHIAFAHYVGGSSFDVKYARGTENNWSIQTVDYGGNNDIISLALDSTQNPHVFYFDRFNNTVKYAKLTGNNWSIEVVNLVGYGGGGLSLALDSSDNPHISYPDPMNDYLRYAAKLTETPSRSLNLDIDPNTLNLKSRGRWITAYLTTEGANADEIDASSLLLNDVLSPECWDVQNNTTLMAKFSRAAVQAILPISDIVDIKISGQWKDGETFELHDIIRVILPGKVPLGPKSITSRFESISYFKDDLIEASHPRVDVFNSSSYWERHFDKRPQRTSLGKGLI